MVNPEFRSNTRMSEQPALRTSRGLSWLLVGALTMVACGGLLIVLSVRQPMTGFIGAGVVVAIYLTMVVVTFTIRTVRARLVTLAVLLIAMVLVALGFVLTISAAEWSALV